VLLSYHGLPEAQLEAQGIGCFEDARCCESDERVRAGCYRAQCFATSRALAAALDLSPERHTICFQSRLGRRPWIKPYTDLVIADLAKAGVRRLAVMCPAFTADCLETVEEIGIRLRADWQALGGEALHLCPCPNGSDAFADAVCDLVVRRAAQ
jgi:ferrochelatase